MKRVLITYLLPALLVVGIVLLFLRMQDHRTLTHAKSARESGAPIPVDIAPVAAGEVAMTLPTECVAMANPLLRIVNPVAGRQVISVRAALGQAVRGGQPLLTLDDREERTAMANAAEQVRAFETLVAAHRERAAYWARVRAEGLGLERDARQAQVELARAEADLVNARATFNAAQATLARLVVTAPVDGMLLAIAGRGESEFGRMIGATDDRTGAGAIAAIGVVDPILLECELPEDKLVFVRQGQSVDAAFPSAPGHRYTGLLKQVRPSAQPERRTVTAVVELPNPERRLLPGVHGNLQVQERWQGIRIPAVALVNPRSDVAQVFVIDASDRARLRRIVIGGSGDGWVQVLEGLSVGDRLVVMGQVALQEGDAVRIGRTLESPAGTPAR